MMKNSVLLEIVNCPIVARFHLYGECPITTCLYNSQKCKHSCIKLGSNSDTDSKGLSVAEISYYKFGGVDKKTIKDLNCEKKTAILRIQILYVFNYYLDYIRTTHVDTRILMLNLFEEEMHSDLSAKQQYIVQMINNVLNRYPFNIKHLKIEFADLVLLISGYLFDKYVKTNKVQIDIDLETVLDLTKGNLNLLRFVTKKYLKAKEITHEFD